MHPPARLRWNGALRIASAMNLIHDVLPWVVLLLGLSLPLLAVLLLG
jgi:spore maturation protein SpmB